MNETKIAWTTYSWNPASGCRKVSAGCRFCYAWTLAERKRGTAGFPNGFDLTLRPWKLDEPRAIARKAAGKGARPMIFVNSMSDLFLEEIPDEYRDRIFDTMEQCPELDFQALTKRPEEMLRYSRRRRFPVNLWAGVTVESERYLNRIEPLLEVEASVRFVSAEPLLSRLPGKWMEGLDWVIVGGESGAHLLDAQVRADRGLVEHSKSSESGRERWSAREDRMDWVREIRDVCAGVGVAFFFKQWGGVRGEAAGNELDGRKWEEWPTRG